MYTQRIPGCCMLTSVTSSSATSVHESCMYVTPFCFAASGDRQEEFSMKGGSLAFTGVFICHCSRTFLKTAWACDAQRTSHMSNSLAGSCVGATLLYALQVHAVEVLSRITLRTSLRVACRGNSAPYTSRHISLSQACIDPIAQPAATHAPLHLRVDPETVNLESRLSEAMSCWTFQQFTFYGYSIVPLST